MARDMQELSNSTERIGTWLKGRTASRSGAKSQDEYRNSPNPGVSRFVPYPVNLYTNTFAQNPLPRRLITGFFTAPCVTNFFPSLPTFFF